MKNLGHVIQNVELSYATWIQLQKLKFNRESIWFQEIVTCFLCLDFECPGGDT